MADIEVKKDYTIYIAAAIVIILIIVFFVWYLNQPNQDIQENLTTWLDADIDTNYWPYYYNYYYGYWPYRNYYSNYYYSPYRRGRSRRFRGYRR